MKTYKIGDVVTDRKAALHLLVDDFVLKDQEYKNQGQKYKMDTFSGCLEWYGWYDDDLDWHLSEHFGNGPWTIVEDLSKPKPQQPPTLDEALAAFDAGKDAADA
jgi:hypothetical protein